MTVFIKLRSEGGLEKQVGFFDVQGTNVDGKDITAGEIDGHRVVVISLKDLPKEVSEITLVIAEDD